MKKITERSKQAQRTKMNIIKTGLGLMKEKGYENIKILDICKAADISVGAFYHHFDSKENLINEAFAMYDVALENIIEDYHNEDALEAIQYVLLNHTEYVLNEGGALMGELYKALFSNKKKYAIQGTRFYYKTVLKFVEQGIKNNQLKEVLSPQEMADYFIRSNRGTIIDWCYHDCSYDLIACVKGELKLMLNYFKI